MISYGRHILSMDIELFIEKMPQALTFSYSVVAEEKQNSLIQSGISTNILEKTNYISHLLFL
jgi:hypothetical protein